MSIVAKLKKLLAIAEDDAASEAEIQNALTIAQRLMDSHHLTEADLLDDPLGEFESLSRAECGMQCAQVGKRLYAWESGLAHVCCSVVGGIKWYDAGKQVRRNHAGLAVGGWAVSVVFYGVAEDCVLAAVLFRDLRAAIIAMSRLRCGSVFMGDGAAYCQGFVFGLSEQVDRQRLLERTEVERSGESHALMVLNRREAIIARKADMADQWLESQGMSLRNARVGGTKTGSSAAFSDGRCDGSKYEMRVERNRKIC